MCMDGIGIASGNELGKVSLLWQKTFGDSKEYVDGFLSFCRDEFVPFVYRDGGRIVSALFLLRGEIKTGGSLYSAGYFYAGCTDENYRGRGYYSALMNYIDRYAEENRIDFLLCVPGEESLYDYYERFGYRSVMFRRKYVFNRDELEKSVCLKNESVSEFVWNGRMYDYAVREAELTGGKYLSRGSSHAFIREDGDFCSIYECGFEDFDAFRKMILEESVAVGFEMLTSCGVQLSLPSEVVGNGVLKCITDDVKCEECHIGLTFE